MPANRVNLTTRQMERYVKSLGTEKFVLRLYVTGATPASTRAITNLKALCQKHLKGRYRLEVIDIFQHPKLAEGEQILTAPTLIKLLPPPIHRFVGDLSDLEGRLFGMDVLTLANPPQAAKKRPPS